MLGIAIGVATILGLGLVTGGLATSAQQALTADAADFTVIAGTTGGGGGPDDVRRVRRTASGQEVPVGAAGGWGGDSQFFPVPPFLPSAHRQLPQPPQDPGRGRTHRLPGRVQYRGPLL